MTLKLFCALICSTILSGGLSMLQPMEIDKDTQLDPNKTYGPIVIKASNITIDGQGAWVVGGTGNPTSFRGNGILAKGVSKVTLRNINVKGFETGLRIEDGEGWQIEGCNFSDNFHDPKKDWGDHGRKGGIVLTRLHKSVLKKNKANNVWDGCVLVDSNENKLEENDFSHTSNTCLRMWTACRNEIRKNNLSYGIRVSPGEVHARDSTSVLIESGSNDNKFIENDATHGGDGFFLRVLNGWVSTGNLFEGNDASYAHNNCFESWSPGNTYIKNKANYGSYGFWMGGSDKSVLIDNEVAFNGVEKGHRNSPHLPSGGFAGIVFMFGPGSHTIIQGNNCHHNNGAGIALIGDDLLRGRKQKAFHWIIQQNKLEENRWGVYMEYADWIDMAANEFKNNKEDVRKVRAVTNLTEYAENPKITKPPKVVMECQTKFKVGEKVIFDASKSFDPGGNKLSYRWDMGDGTILTEPKIEHVYKEARFYRMGLTINNGLLSDLASIDVHAVDDIKELGTETESEEWVSSEYRDGLKTCSDNECLLMGKASLKITFGQDPYGIRPTAVQYPKTRKAQVDISAKTHLVFWVRFIDPNRHTPNDILAPVVTMHESDTKSIKLIPKSFPLPYSEARAGWVYYKVPLSGDKQWKAVGELPAQVNWITVDFGVRGKETVTVWLDGLGFK